LTRQQEPERSRTKGLGLGSLGERNREIRCKAILFLFQKPMRQGSTAWESNHTRAARRCREMDQAPASDLLPCYPAT
jgi:hypothetical protein